MRRFVDSVMLKLSKLLFERKRVTLFDIFFSYRLIRQRLPDNQGWHHYLKQIRDSELSLESLVNTFLGSEEFSAKRQLSANGREAHDHESLPPEEEVVELPEFRIVIDKNDQFIGEAIRRDQLYEPHVTRIIREVLKPGHSFVDIGANIGYFSLMASRLVGPNGMVIAFEPMDQNFVLLSKSIELNGFKNIKSYNIAVSNENKTIGMILWDRRNSGSFHIVNRVHCDRKIYQIEAKRLDDILHNECVDLIKIDVEGAEGLVFDGMINTIRRTRPLVIRNSPRPDCRIYQKSLAKTC